MIVAAAVAAILGAYACELDAPRAITLYPTGDVAAASQIGLLSMVRRFRIEIRDGTPLMAKVDWPGDPMQVAGKFPAIRSAPGAFAFSAFSTGPCLFTEGPCLTQVTLVDNGTEPPQAVIAPAAVAKKGDKGDLRFALPVLAEARCTRAEPKP